MKKNIKYFFIALLLAPMTLLWADIIVPINFTAPNDDGKAAGKVTITTTQYGLLFTPDLQGLTPGLHGFHLHQNPTCAQNGIAAGGHYDPQNTAKHLGSYISKGHLGDLPALYVNADGTATLPVLAPRIKDIKKVEHLALMIHEGGDNYSDTPAKLGGGAARMLCGVVP